jgi:SAM-dependent methyltransferase
MNVRALYEEFPFPYRGNHGDLIAKYIVPSVPVEAPSILDAGCGTGNLALDTARLFPNASVTGVDFSEASLNRARELAREAQLPNLEFQRQDLMEPFAPGRAAGPHRFVMSIGCIHHTPDPALCLRNLRRVVADEGVFVLCVYAKHGRIETEFRRSLVDHFRQATGKSNRELLALYAELDGEPVLARNRLRKAPALTLRYFAQRGLERVQAKLGSRNAAPAASSTEIGDADQFLHPLVHNWSAKRWIQTLDAAGFRLQHFVHDVAANGWCIPENPIDRLQDPELRALLTNMTLTDRYEAFDLLYRPILHFIVCKPRSMQSPS